MIQIWTIQIAQHRKAKALDIHFIDSTAMSGSKFLAPDFANVRAYKEGRMTEAEYTEAYVKKMEASLAQHPEVWHYFKKYEKQAIGCYCPKGKFCHRHILADMVFSYLLTEGVEAEIIGEL